MLDSKQFATRKISEGLLEMRAWLGILREIQPEADSKKCLSEVIVELEKFRNAWVFYQKHVLGE